MVRQVINYRALLHIICILIMQTVHIGLFLPILWEQTITILIIMYQVPLTHLLLQVGIPGIMDIPPPQQSRKSDRRYLTVRILFTSLPQMMGPLITVRPDRKSTRLNSSHLGISYAV